MHTHACIEWSLVVQDCRLPSLSLDFRVSGLQPGLKSLRFRGSSSGRKPSLFEDIVTIITTTIITIIAIITIITIVTIIVNIIVVIMF